MRLIGLDALSAKSVNSVLQLNVSASCSREAVSDITLEEGRAILEIVPQLLWIEAHIEWTQINVEIQPPADRCLHQYYLEDGCYVGPDANGIGVSIS